MDRSAFGITKQLCEHIDESVPRETASQTEYARRRFAALDREGGQVVALDSPVCMKTKTADLGTWSEDPWPEHTYGLDASTTTPIEFNNGLLFDVAYAKLGVVGAGADRALERRGTIRTVVHFEDDESRFYPQTFETDEGRINGAVLAFRGPASTNGARDVARSVSTVAQRLAEGRHAAAHADELDGALFIDGSVYPLGVLYWLMLEAVGRSSMPADWEKPREIATHYIDLIDAQYEKGLPVLGIVKTSMTNQLLDALEAKIGESVPWQRDHQFVSEVLRDDSLNHLTYTSWFVHEQTEIDNRSFEMLSTVADRLRHGDPPEYRRAFFYVRLPKTGGVLRVEAPLLMVEDGERREAVQRKALCEIARRGDVPRAVARADRIARISPDNRDRIRDLIASTESYHDYNEDGRWKDIEDPYEASK